MKCAHLNINSVRHKFAPLVDVLSRSMIDILSLQETKIDESFPCSQFSVPGYLLHRKDYKENCGGLIMLIRDDLPQMRRQDEETFKATSGRIEFLVIELMLNNKKWIMFKMYKQSQVKNDCIIEVVRQES